MLFASNNPTNPRTDPWNFHKKILRIDRVEKWPIFESAILIFFFQKEKKIASSPWKLVTNYALEWMGLYFQYYDDLQPKIRAGIINEHECSYIPTHCWLNDFFKFIPQNHYKLFFHCNCNTTWSYNGKLRRCPWLSTLNSERSTYIQALYMVYHKRW